MSLYVRYSPATIGGGGGGLGVESLNSLTGVLTLVGGTGITVTPSGSNITISNTGGVSSVTATSPLFSSGGTTPNLTIQVANTSQNGYLSSTDWNTFNGKQSTLTLGNLTESGSANLTVSGGTGAVIGSGVLLTLTGATLLETTSSVLTITGGTNAVLGTGVTIAVKQAATAQSGYLSSTDWNTFNGKQAAGNYITALTGDVTATGPGSVAGTVARIAGTVVSGTTGTTNVVFSGSPTITTPVIASITSGAGTFTHNTTGTITVPNATDTLVGKATADTLTNKSISGSTNTLSNISNAALTNSTITIGSTSTSLGGTSATISGLTVATGTFTGTSTFPSSTTIDGSGNATLGGTLKGSGTNGAAPVQGTNSNDAPASGTVGEFLSITQNSAQSLVTATIKNITSLALTGGDWDVWAIIGFISGGGVVSTTAEAAISTANNTVVGTFDGSYWTAPIVMGNFNLVQTVGPTRITVASGSSPTTYFLNCDAAFSVGTVTAKGSIFARRRR